MYLDEQVCVGPSQWLRAASSCGFFLQSQSVFTCGEDGFVRVWKPADDDVQAPVESAKGARPKEKRQKDRFKPY